MAKIKASDMISNFQKMYREKWSFKLGSAKEGCVDCSGAFVYTYGLYGQSIYHGSNRIAREYVVQLIPYSEAKSSGQIVPGMAAFRSRQPGQSYYDLPAEYQQGGAHYNGDLTDYNHIGLVDEDTNYVLNAANPFAKTSITDRWTHVAKLTAVDYGSDITDSSASNDGKTKFGIFGWSGNSAKNLFNSIRSAAQTEFDSILADNSAEKFKDDLSKSWTGYKVQNNSNIYRALACILKTSTGKSYQDNKALSDLSTMLNNGITKGLSRQSTLMMYVYVCFRGYKDFADSATNGASDSTLDTYYISLINKFSSYPDDVRAEMKRVYEYIQDLENNGTISTNIDGGSDLSTPTGGTDTLTGGDGTNSAAKYNNWWITLSFKLGSTHLNPSDKQVWNAHRIYRILTSNIPVNGFTYGYSRAAACGILGNMQTESGLSPGCLQSGKKSQLPNNGTNISSLTNNVILGWHGSEYSYRGYGLGLIQWDSNTNNPPAGNTIASFAINNNKLWYDGDLQLMRLGFEYLHDKSGGNQPTDSGNTYSFWYPSNYKISGTGVTWAAYKSMADPEKCADIFRACRERSSGDATGNKNRRENAKYWYNYFANNPADPWTTSAASTVTGTVTSRADDTVAASNGPNTDAVKPNNFKQFSGSWADVVFGPAGRPSTDTYRNSACSVTAMADIVWKFADSSVTPKTIGDLAISWGYRTRTSNGLTDMNAFCSRCASHYGFIYKGKTTGTSCYDKLRSALDSGHNNTLAIIGVKGIFSNNGHFVVAYKTNGDKTCICDPGISSSSTRGVARENCSSSDLKAAINSVYIFQKK